VLRHIIYIHALLVSTTPAEP